MGCKKGSVVILVAFFVLAILVGGFFVSNKFISVVSKQSKATQEAIDRDVTLSSGANLRTSYANPFDEKTQYSNPFGEYKNPIDQLP